MLIKWRHWEATTISISLMIVTMHTSTGHRYVCPPIVYMLLHDNHDLQGHHTDVTAFAKCGGPVSGAAAAAPARDGPIVPSNCKTHLTCQPVHPNRPDPWTDWGAYIGDWLTYVGIGLAGSAVVIGGCVYGKMAIDKNRKKRRDARLKAEGRKPPSDGSESEGSDEDLRGQRG